MAKIMDSEQKTTPPPFLGSQYSPQQYTSPQYTGQGYPKQHFSTVTPSAAGCPPGDAGFPPGAAGFPPGAAGYPPAPVAQVIYHVPPPMPYGLTNRPDDWLFFNICTCLCCCWPISIFGIWKSMESRKAADRGDREAAIQNADMANKLGLASFIIGLLIDLIIFVVFIVYAFEVVEKLANEAKNVTDVANETTTTLYTLNYI